MADDMIAALRAALAVSPDNLPLVQHLGSSLIQLGRGPEAEQEFRLALTRWTNDPELKLGLARAFELQGKTSHATVVIEELCGRPDAPARALVLHARFLLRTGDVEKAVRTYKRGIAADPTAADSMLAGQLGVHATGTTAPDDADIVDGRVRDAHGAAQAPASTTEVERPRQSFADVGGMDAVKEEIRLKIIYPLQHADLYRAYGKSIGGGILLYGPPG
jgi:hypothetical protein